MSVPCNEIQHRWGETPDGEWIEIYYSQTPAGEIIHFEQVIPAGQPSQTPIAQLGLQRGWCSNAPSNAVITPPAATQSAETVGMGSFFLLIVVAIGVIRGAMYLQTRNTSNYLPPMDADIWHRLPPADQRIPDDQWVAAPIGRRAVELVAEHNHRSLTPITPETPQTIGQTTIQTEGKPDLNQGSNRVQPEGKPDLNQGSNRVQPEGKPDLNQGVTLPIFDPLEDERPGEFEFYLALLRVNQWSPRCKAILKSLWGANPNTQRYEPAILRRNQFANRFEESSAND